MGDEMNKQKQVLIIGRFQPLCSNHKKLFEKAKTIGDEILVGVGTPNYTLAKEHLSQHEFNNYQLSYLFSYDEVHKWITEAIGSYPHTIVNVEDVVGTKNYEEHVVNVFETSGKTIDDCILYGDNPYTYKSFSSMPFMLAQGVSDIRATLVREEIYRTGKSDDLACELTAGQRKKIMKYVDLKNKLGDEDELVYNGHIALIKKMHEGKLYDAVVSPDAVAALYIDPLDNVWLTKQYRPPIQREIIEAPAETIDKPGLDPLSHIIEGLEEECGIIIENPTSRYVGAVGSSEGHDSEYVHLYVVKGNYVEVGQHLDESEKISVVKMPFLEAYEKMKAGEIQGAKTAILLQNEYIDRLEKHGTVGGQ